MKTTVYNFSANGMDFGNYTAATLAAARTAFARDANYAGWGVMVKQAAEFGGNSVEVREVLENGQLGPKLTR